MPQRELRVTANLSAVTDPKFGDFRAEFAPDQTSRSVAALPKLKYRLSLATFGLPSLFLVGPLGPI